VLSKDETSITTYICFEKGRCYFIFFQGSDNRYLARKVRIFRPIIISALSLSILVGTLASTHADGLTALAKPVARGPQSDESVYFVMTDRFANGDTSNDQAGLTGDRYSTGFDPTDIGWWHGGDFTGLTAHLDYIKAMGFTAIWITPPVKQQYVQGSSGAYHGYWGVDFTTVDPHLGTEAEFKNFVDHAHTLGLKVILDVVANHTADVIKYKVGKAFPYIPEELATIKKPAWLNDINNYHNLGDSTFSGDSVLNGDFYGLDDLFTEKPAVVQGWTQVWSDWITKFGIDGLRIDTFKHVDPAFWKAVLPKVLAVAAKAGKVDFPIFGEASDVDVATLATYVSEHQTPSVLDFAFQQNVAMFANGGDSSSLLALFNDDDAYTTSTTSAYGLATFLGNHDMGRTGMILSQYGSDAEILEKSKLANALLFLLRGGPILYYGDEIGMAGSGGDKSARQDMFATEVPEWQSETRIGGLPIGTASGFDTPNPLRDEITQLQSVIAANPALRSGTQQSRYAKKSTYVATRFAGNQEYIIAFNSGDVTEQSIFTVGTPSAEWSVIAGAGVQKTTGTSVTLTLAPRSYVVFKAGKKFVPQSKLSITLKPPAVDYLMQRWVGLSATVAGNDYTEVTFAARKVGGAWKIIGTSDRRTVAAAQTKGGLYRVFLHPADYKIGTKIEVVAIAKNAAGIRVASKILKYEVR